MTAPHTASTADLPPPRPEVRAKVKELLTKTDAFHQLPKAEQMEVAKNTALIADALVGSGSPGARPPARGMAGETSLGDGSGVGGGASFREAQRAVSAIGGDEFGADAVFQGGAAAASFMKQVNFVEFVSGLIDGVFNSIVSSNITQMEAYAKLVSDVAKSLNQFRDENTTEDDGKDQLIEQFPDIFDIGIDDFSMSQTPTLRVKDDVDQDSALARVQSALGSYAEGGIDSIDVSDPEAQAKLIKAARSHIATSRQQLLATMVLMGLSRIVVTNGKIQAKIMYDFNASSARTVSRSAQAMDYARNADGSLATLWEGEGEYDSGGKSTYASDGSYKKGEGSYTGRYDADYYSKGKYKYAQKPVVTAVSMAADTQSDQLTARASLMGAVEVNFKTDYLELNKMATPEMIAALQMRSKPVDHNKPVDRPMETPAAGSGGSVAPAPAPAGA